MTDEERERFEESEDKFYALCDWLEVEIRGDHQNGYVCKSRWRWEREDNEALRRNLELLKKSKGKK